MANKLAAKLLLSKNFAGPQATTKKSFPFTRQLQNFTSTSSDMAVCRRGENPLSGYRKENPKKTPRKLARKCEKCYAYALMPYQDLNEFIDAIHFLGFSCTNPQI